ncbi:hypothetical protein Cph01nite_19080 [Cellulomonas phragmiteti]|uniref:Uncharacterized protein n=3 Tax=Actinomycetes TaxID=1760 RepID=A0ABQ4DMJ8_9CELL|nr:hypothetical protein Cph01nite_19080 [Cellulomonas phragmiteti]
MQVGAPGAGQGVQERDDGLGLLAHVRDIGIRAPALEPTTAARTGGVMWDDGTTSPVRAVFARAATRGEPAMSKRGRKRRSRKGNAANHGKRPNA